MQTDTVKTKGQTKAQKLFGFGASLFLGGILFFLGYSIYIGTPIQSEGVTFRTLDPDMLQDWLIRNFGESTTGLGFMGFGVLLPFFVLWRVLRSNKG